MVTFVSPSQSLTAIYGGTFDPFHIGHESIALNVLAEPAVEQLRLMPCSIPALKAKSLTLPRHRLAMLKQWVDKCGDRVEVDDREVRRGGRSYSVDSLMEIAKENPELRLVFVMGADAWNSLKDWKDADKIEKVTRFWVFSRVGERLNVRDNPAVDSALALANASCGAVYFDSRPISEMASSAIRQHGDKSQWPVPEVIKQYITQHALY